MTAEFFDSQGLADYLQVSIRFIKKHQKRIAGGAKISGMWMFEKNAIEKQLLTGFLFPEDEKKYRYEAREHEGCRYETAKLIYQKVLKREPCAVCGEMKVHAHHNNYSDPQDITWLCPDCHYQYHREKRKLSAA